jgi:uncharacterized protein (TIGR02996 family)
MTTEDDFQRALDANPGDWQTRLVFADWLQERNDPRAEGYRALGRLQVWPYDYTTRQLPGFKSRRKGWQWWADTNDPAGAVARHIVPKGVSELLETHFHRTRRAAEDAVARAFAKLPARQRAKLLAVKATE